MSMAREQVAAGWWRPLITGGEEAKGLQVSAEIRNPSRTLRGILLETVCQELRLQAVRARFWDWQATVTKKSTVMLGL